jgi:hypothetical protein
MINFMYLVRPFHIMSMFESYMTLESLLHVPVFHVLLLLYISKHLLSPTTSTTSFFKSALQSSYRAPHFSQCSFYEQFPQCKHVPRVVD